MRIGLFGLPGAGKGTQAGRLAKDCAIPHISTGDMFREMQTGTSQLAQEIREILASGELVSDEMVTKLAFERLSQDDCKRGFILDGYPRTLSQAEVLQQSPFALHGLICIDVDRDEVIRRLSDRRVCEQCKSVYSASDVMGIDGITCPKDGSTLAQRADDTVEAVTNRLVVYERNFLPVVNFFQTRDRLFRVNGNGSADDVFDRLKKLIEHIGRC